MADTQEKRTRGQYDLSLYGSPLYKSWSNMKTRCTNVKVADYPRYGGRGITYCTDWETFDGFIRDMQITYKKGLTLERKDNNGNYCKQNCIWATRTKQCNNRSTNRLLTLGETTKTLADWCKLSRVKPSTIRQRFYVYGWNLKKSLSI